MRMAAQREEWGEDGCTEGGIGRGWLYRGRNRERMAAQREGWAGMTEQRAGLATQFKRRNGYWCRKVLAQLPWRCPYFRERCLLRKVSLYNVYTSHKMDNCCSKETIEHRISNHSPFLTQHTLLKEPQLRLSTF